MSAYQCTSDSVEKDEAYRSMLDVLTRGLSSEMLEAFKYQCLDHIGRGKLEKIHSFSDLFLVLEQRDVVCAENVDFFILSLENLSRKDLMNVVQQYKKEWLSTDDDTMKAYDTFLEETVSKPANEQAGASSSSNQPPIVQSTVQSDALPYPTAGYVPEGGVIAPAPLDPFHEALISYISSLLAADWLVTARFMGVSDDIISAAQYNWPRDMRRQIYETFAEYSRNGGHISREIFVEALSISGRNDLAQDLLVRNL